MNPVDKNIELVRPEFMYVNNSPEFSYCAALDIGLSYPGGDISIDALEVTNLSPAGMDYYTELFNRNKGTENTDNNLGLRLLYTANNNNYLFITKDKNNKIHLYVAPEEEMSFKEKDLLGSMRKDKVAKLINEWTPFTSSDRVEYSTKYNNALENFHKAGYSPNGGMPFESTVGKIAA